MIRAASLGSCSCDLDLLVNSFFAVRNLKASTVKMMTPLCIVVLSAFVLCVSGCGKSNPNANVPKEKMAPAPQDLGNDPEYAKQFGGQGKK